MLEVLHDVLFKMAGVLYRLRILEAYDGNIELPTVNYKANAKRDDISIDVTFTYPYGVSLIQKRHLFNQAVKRLTDITSVERATLSPYDFCNTGILFEKIKAELQDCFANAIETETFRKRCRAAKRLGNEKGCNSSGTRCK